LGANDGAGAGEVADVADSFFADSGSGRTLVRRRASSASYGVMDNDRQIPGRGCASVLIAQPGAAAAA
jgi:hypothetical protein